MHSELKKCSNVFVCLCCELFISTVNHCIFLLIFFFSSFSTILFCFCYSLDIIRVSVFISMFTASPISRCYNDGVRLIDRLARSHNTNSANAFGIFCVYSIYHSTLYHRHLYLLKRLQCGIMIYLKRN